MRSLLALLIILLLSTVAYSDTSKLTVEQQIQIVTDYMAISNQSHKIPSAFRLGYDEPIEFHEPAKCGMSAAMEFSMNRHLISKDVMQSMGLSTMARPDLQSSFVSPEGLFKIHYDVSGSAAVYEPEKDSDNDGVPDYVESVAEIFEYVYHYVIDTLGYPVPPTDEDVDGDPTYDVFIGDFDVSAYGYTASDDPDIPVTSNHRISSYIEIDNDYKNISRYKDRPLDAVKVTAAHEYFHAIHFGLDYKEFESYYVPANLNRRYWMEMTSTWMEEEIYDDVNDYYAYIPVFFNNPHLSIQQFSSYSDLHPYGAVVFPIFLVEKFGKEMIRDIWLECGDIPGPNLLLALDHALDPLYFDDTTVAQMSTAIPQVFSEFALWNMFTGIRGDKAPNGIGYSERNFYPEIPDFAFGVYNQFPHLQSASKNVHNPDHLAAAYLKFDQLQAFQETSYWVNAVNDSLGIVDTSYWNCSVYLCEEIDPDCLIYGPECCIDSTCFDSVQIFDLNEGYEWVTIDTNWCDTCEMINLSGQNYLYDDGGEIRDTMISSYDFVKTDSALIIDAALDRNFNRTWGATFVYQLASNRDSFVVFDTLLVGEAQHFEILHPRNFRSVTLILSPASELRGFYQYATSAQQKVIGFYATGGMVDSLRESSIDYNNISVSAEVMYAYPNPAVAEQMGSEDLKIRFQIPTDETSQYLYSQPYLTMDIYTVAGEYIRFIDTVVTVMTTDIYSENERSVLYESSWDMKNANGTDVASGVYLIIARLYSGEEVGNLLFETTTKVAIIR